MIYPMVLFPVTWSDPSPRFQSHGDALDVLCAQLMRDLFAIAKFFSLLYSRLSYILTLMPFWQPANILHSVLIFMLLLLLLLSLTVYEIFSVKE